MSTPKVDLGWRSGLAVLREVEPIDDTHAGALERCQRRAKVLDVDRQVVHSRTSPCEKARERALRTRGFHQFDPIVAKTHGHQTEALVVPRVGLDLDDRCEIPLEESHRRVNLPKPEREMIHLPEQSMLGDRAAPARRGEHGRIALLPELHECAERRAGMDERGFVAVSFIETVDNANAVALEPLEVPREPIDLERQMMKAFAATGEEAIDEAPRPRALDELDLEIADGEVGPEEFRRIP